MAWTYSDWITQTSADTRLSRLRLHIQEVADALTASYQSDGTSYNPAHLNTYLSGLHQQEAGLTAGSNINRVSRVRLRGMR